jgi:putative transposase
MEFRTQAGCSRLETANAAYTSQTCPNPTCGVVHKDNRHGDRFHCLACGWDGDADVVAGMNLLSRLNDAEIHLWTPKEQVKAILEVRFRRRKETRKHAANVLPTGTPLTAGL